MSLRSELKALQEGLSIEHPVRVTRPWAFESVAGNIRLAQRPAVFENTPFAPREEGQMGATREYTEIVRVRFTAYDADFPTAIEIADAFKSAFMTAIAGQRRAGARLNGTFENVVVTGTETPFEAVDGRPGWEVDLEFTKFETVVLA